MEAYFLRPFETERTSKGGTETMDASEVLNRVDKLWSKADTLALESKKREKAAKDGWTEEKCKLERSIHKM